MTSRPPERRSAPFPGRIIVPFNKPTLTGRELEYIAEAVEGGHLSGDGPFTSRCQDFLERQLEVKRAFLTTSGTHALEMSALLADVGPDDEVIVPSFTFVSTAAAFALRGAKLVFADIRPDTFNLDVSQLPSLVSPKTRAIVPVHYAGVACEMEAVLQAAGTVGASVIEDAAHAFPSRYKGRPLGSIGDLAILSFHETKNVTSGEGGALLINDDRHIDRAERLWHKGTNRLSYFRGEVDRYTWLDLGSSFAPSDILAAFLLAQLENHRDVTERRRSIWEYYLGRLRPWATRAGVQLPHVPDGCEPSYHLFSLLFPDRALRDTAIDELESRGLVAPFHYSPLHSSPAGRRWGICPLDCPVAESVSQRLMRLPFYNTLDRDSQDRVVQALEEVV